MFMFYLNISGEFGSVPLANAVIVDDPIPPGAPVVFMFVPRAAMLLIECDEMFKVFVGA